MKRLLLAALAGLALFVPASAQAQDRVTIDAAYHMGTLEPSFDYPKELGLMSGKRYDTNGLDLTIGVRITDVIGIQYRSEYLPLRNARSIEDDRTRGGRRIEDSPDPDQSSGLSGYRELSGVFTIPHTGHALIVGLAKMDFDRTWGWSDDESTTLKIAYKGLVIGGQGHVRTGPVSFDYSGRYYPRLSRTDQYLPGEGGSTPIGSDSTGYNLRGSVTWWVVNHVGLSGGYQFRRLRTEVPDDFWPINETDTDKGPTVGLKISF